MNRISGIALLLSLLTLASCQLFRGKGSGKGSSVIDSTSLVTKPASPDSGISGIDTAVPFLWDYLQQRPAGYSTFNGKAHASYESAGNTQDFDVQIRLERDRRIWVSVTAVLGLELARVMITPDSLQALDRIHHDAYLLRLADAGQLLPFPADFSLLQAIILGEPLPVHAAFAGMSSVADTSIFIGQSTSGRQELGISLRDSSLFRQELKQEPNYLRIINDRLELIDGMRFPKVRAIQALNAGTLHRIVLEFSEAHFNQELDFNFSVPSRYERK